jgi:aspartyl-tRNA(Asn)/glutamyl-tRNA(Gln) amidotransferase subunit C
MALTKQQVLHVARLADLALEPDEVDRLAGELGAILDHIAELNELDTRDVPPTAHVSVLQMPLRDDVIEPGLEANVVLGESPRVDGGGFAVPKFLDEP